MKFYKHNGMDVIDNSGNHEYALCHDILTESQLKLLRDKVFRELESCPQCEECKKLIVVTMLSAGGDFDISKSGIKCSLPEFVSCESKNTKPILN